MRRDKNDATTPEAGGFAAEGNDDVEVRVDIMCRGGDHCKETIGIFLCCFEVP